MTSAKAIVGGILSALLAGLSSLGNILVGNATLSTVTTAQWIGVLIAVLTAGGSVFGVVWAVSNKPAEKAAVPADPSAPVA